MAAAAVDCPGSLKSVRIVVVGDKGTGKSSLIVAAATDSFPPNVPPVLPDTKLPFEFFPDGKCKNVPQNALSSFCFAVAGLKKRWQENAKTESSFKHMELETDVRRYGFRGAGRWCLDCWHLKRHSYLSVFAANWMRGMP